jgi:hypothetical protein
MQTETKNEKPNEKSLMTEALPPFDKCFENEIESNAGSAM